jgi:membrane protein DedA with SNARE-associated domain
MLGETLLGWVSQHGYAGLFVLLMLGIVGIPVPDEFLLTFTGYLVSQGRLELGPAILTAFLGSSCGISLSYIIGRAGGFWLVHRFGRYVGLTAERVEKVHWWFERRGRWALMFGYFFAGIRHLTALTAGSAKLDLLSFAIFAYSGALLWASTFVLLGYFLGERWQTASEEVHQVALIITGVAVVLGVGWLLLRRLKGARVVPPSGPGPTGSD